MAATVSSFNASDHEREERLLAVTLQPHFVEACLGCATAGILLFMCIYGLNAYLETPKQLRHGRKFYVVISFVILILHSCGEMPYTYYIFHILYKSSNWKEAYSIRDKLDLTWWIHASNWASSILVWVGDGLLVYRCHLVWIGRPMVIVLPAIIYLAAVGLSLFEMIPYSGKDQEAQWNAFSAWVFLSAGVNCIVTFLISWRLLRMRKQQAELMPLIDSKVYIGIIGILVESALPLALVGVMAAGSQWVTSQPTMAMHNHIEIVWYNFTALAPALIIFRVTAGRSWDRNSQAGSHLTALAFQSNRFQSAGSGVERDIEAAPLDSDVKKNEPIEVIQGQVPCSDVVERDSTAKHSSSPQLSK